ncbi:hypothetical protein G9A89_005901 [Geosiphon pyriformis]|nr:hypothetical protein G9A89_005901 [Geosiphon pyriformis]
MKKIAEKSGSGGSFKSVLSKKKRKDVALEENVGGKGALTKVSGGHSWGSETSNTIESESINMEEKCLVEETSFDYEKSGTIINEEHDQTLKEPGIKTKKTLGKPLGKIDFLNLGIGDNILLDVLLVLLSSLKNLIPVFVRKFFALDISLDKVVGKSSQEKLMVVRRLFSKVNSFGEASTSSKFSGIIHASFISEASLVQAIEKARAVDILVNTDLKKSTGHLDQAVVVKEISVGTLAEAVCAALSEFGIIKSIKMQLVELWQKAVVEFEQSD